MKEIGDRMREAREKLGMTQGDLAAKLGVHVATVTLWENRKNRRQIGTKHIQKVAETLKLRVSELLGEDKAKQSAPPLPPRMMALDQAETQLLRLFRLMPEELKLFQLAQFVECAGSGKLTYIRGHDSRQVDMPDASTHCTEPSESR